MVFKLVLLKIRSCMNPVLTTTVGVFLLLLCLYFCFVRDSVFSSVKYGSPFLGKASYSIVIEFSQWQCSYDHAVSFPRSYCLWVTSSSWVCSGVYMWHVHTCYRCVGMKLGSEKVFMVCMSTHCSLLCLQVPRISGCCDDSHHLNDAERWEAPEEKWGLRHRRHHLGLLLVCYSMSSWQVCRGKSSLPSSSLVWLVQVSFGFSVATSRYW